MEILFKTIIELLKKLVGLDEMETKYQTGEVTKAAATPAGVYEDKITLEDGWELADGVKIIELTDGGIAYYLIALQDDVNVYHSMAHKEGYIADSNVSMNERYKKVNIPVITGNKIQIKTKLPVVAVSEIKYLVEFRLRRKKRGS